MPTVCFCLIASFALASCASPYFSGNPIDIDSAEIFFSRSSLTKTEFEHYRLGKSDLFYECGEIHRGSFLEDEQELAPIDEERLRKISEGFGDIADYLAQNYPTQILIREGNDSGFADPGRFEISLQGSRTLELKGAFDPVADRQGLLEEKLFRVARLLRGIPEKPPCGNRDFFGIPAGSAESRRNDS